MFLVFSLVDVTEMWETATVGLSLRSEPVGARIARAREGSRPTVVISILTGAAFVALVTLLTLATLAAFVEMFDGSIVVDIWLWYLHGRRIDIVSHGGAHGVRGGGVAIASVGGGGRNGIGVDSGRD